MEWYVYVSRGDSKATGALQMMSDEDPSLKPRYVAELLSGPWAQLLFYEGTDHGHIVKTVGAVRDRVNPGIDAAIQIRPGPSAPTHWSPKPTLSAYVRVSVKPGRAEVVHARLHSIKGYWGSATVAGSFHILLEVGGETVDGVMDELHDHLGKDPDVVSFEPAFHLNKAEPTQTSPA
jgi:hypothetical protein